jgi:asparagine synthase (glutamine-hydrolysing)
MCGIAGIIGPKIDPIQRARILDTMRRRGPDGHGHYEYKHVTMLHTRLAIIDPEGGRQPMELEWAGERYVIVYNGELYNTAELRSALKNLGHHFQTASDTEVLLHAYAQWKEACLEKLNGIFAFAVWEETAGVLFIARDRIGVKPLFYIHRPDLFAFASEIKTLLAIPGVKAQLDQEGAAQILLLGPGRIPGSGVLRDIYEVEPGQYGIYRNGILSLRRYWRLQDREHRDNFEETAAKVRYLVCDSIKRQMVSDVPIGTFLSGGLDSSIITAICAKEAEEKGEMLPIFSLDYLGNDRYFTASKFQPNSDTEFIRLMEKTIFCRSHWTILQPDALVQALYDATIARDLPGMADVDSSLLLFCKQIKDHVKVALSGECADEIFGGYPWFRDAAVRQADGFPWAQTLPQRAQLLSPWITERLDPLEFVRSHYNDSISKVHLLPGQSDEEKRMKQMVDLNFRWFMQTLLDRKDRMSMYSGLEVRVPFCDYRIAEYMYAVPWWMKDYGGREKGLLRYAMEGMLPNEILYRKKSPYPKTHDPQYTELVSDELRRVIDDPNSPIFALVPKEKLMQLLDLDFTWPWYGQLMRQPQTIAYMLQLDHWLRQYKVQIV